MSYCFQSSVALNICNGAFLSQNQVHWVVLSVPFDQVPPLTWIILELISAIFEIHCSGSQGPIQYSCQFFKKSSFVCLSEKKIGITRLQTCQNGSK